MLPSRIRVGWGALALAVIVASTAQMSTVGPASGATSTKASTTAAKASGGGCGKIVRPGSSTLTLRVDANDRTVIVYVPSSYTATAKVPLVLNLHGSGSTAAEQQRISGMNAEANLGGFIVAYPQASTRSGSGFTWNVPGVPLPANARMSQSPDDFTFLTDLPGILEQQYCVNSGQVYATGFSQGAEVTSQLACDDSNIFAAVAPVSGLRWPDPCPSIRAVPVVAFHGTADSIDPYGGHGQDGWTYSVPDAARDWARQDDCRGRPLIGSRVDGVTLTEYLGCPGRTSVELYTIRGEGHQWPGGPVVSGAAVGQLLGRQSDAVNADAVMWAFFSAHRLR